MGILRLCLALLVALAHLGISDHFLAGQAIFAVRAFFIISGFYMTVAIQDRYRAKPLVDFYLSRTLKLLPLYWVVALITVALQFGFSPDGPLPLFIDLHTWSRLALAPWAIPYAVISTVTLIGADTGTWLSFANTSVLALNPVPQTWTIGLEICFYAIAPFVVGRSFKVIGILAIAALAFRFGLSAFGFFGGDPWGDRVLFPAELIFFLIGIVAGRVYLATRGAHIGRRFQLIATADMLAVVIACRWCAYAYAETSLIIVCEYGAVAAALPLLFRLTKDWSLDGRLGALSYPVYIAHLTVFSAVTLALPPSHLRGPVELVLLVASAFALDVAVMQPLSRWRERFGARHKGPSESSGNSTLNASA